MALHSLQTLMFVSFLSFPLPVLVSIYTTALVDYSRFFNILPSIRPVCVKFSKLIFFVMCSRDLSDDISVASNLFICQIIAQNSLPFFLKLTPYIIMSIVFWPTFCRITSLASSLLFIYEVIVQNSLPFFKSFYTKRGNKATKTQQVTGSKRIWEKHY